MQEKEKIYQQNKIIAKSLKNIQISTNDKRVGYFRFLVRRGELAAAVRQT